MSITLQQRLCCLLAVTEKEADALLSGKRSEFEAASIGNRVGRTESEVVELIRSVERIEATRIDVNTVTPLQLAQAPGFSITDSGAVMHGFPYYSLEEFESASHLPEHIVSELFSVPALDQLDKVTGRYRRYTPIYGTYIANSRLDFESARAIDGLGFVEQQTRSDSPIRIIRPRKTDSISAVHELKRSLGGQVFPVVSDDEGFERYFLPATLDVWFDQNVSSMQALSAIGNADLRVRLSRPDVGYFQVELAKYPHGANLAALVLNKIEKIQLDANVLFAEPAEVGVEDFAPQNERAVIDFEGSPFGSRQWNMQLIGIDRAHKISRGSSKVSIVTIDSGVDTDHQDLQTALRPDWQSLDLNFDTHAPEDALSPMETNVSHGTKVASIACGRGTGGESRVQGVAPECWLLPIKITGTPSAIGYGLRAAAIREALAYVPEGDRGVINLSWSTNGEHLGVREALFKASELGFAVTTSAGNYRTGMPQQADTLHYPSVYAYKPGGNASAVIERRKIPGLVSVAAVNAQGRKASYSYYGKNSTTISAPGGEPGQAGQGVFVASIGGNYSYDAGTSFAAPHIAGAIALLLSTDPHLSAQAAVDILRTTARDLDTNNPSHAGMLGAGLLDVGAALESLDLTVQPSTPSIISSNTTVPITSKGFPININAGTASHLEQLPGIGPWSAQAIVNFRTLNGPFAKVDDITRSGAIDTWRIASIRNLMIAGPGTLEETGSGNASTNLMRTTPPSNVTRIELNTATIEELLTLPMVGVWAAGKILDYRARNPPFESLNELLLTGAFDSWTISQLEDKLDVQQIV